MAISKPMTLEEILANRGGQVDRARLAATTEEVIRRYMIEDGEDPDAPLLDYQPVPNLQTIREGMNLSHDGFAKALGVPSTTLRHWEEQRTAVAPPISTLLRIFEREPDAALRALQVD